MDVERLKALVAERDLTQKEIARRLGYSENYINQLLNGRLPWNKRTIKLFSISLSIPLEKLAECMGNDFCREFADLLAEEGVAR